jgi:hypothetical protein
MHPPQPSGRGDIWVPAPQFDNVVDLRDAIGQLNVVLQAPSRCCNPRTADGCTSEKLIRCSGLRQPEDVLKCLQEQDTC